MEDGREGRRKERQETSLRKNGLYFSPLFTFSSQLKFMCHLRLFGALGPAGLPRVGLQTLYVAMKKPLMHINLVILEALGKLTHNLIRNVLETFWVSMHGNQQPACFSTLSRCEFFFASFQIGKVETVRHTCLIVTYAFISLTNL